VPGDDRLAVHGDRGGHAGRTSGLTTHSPDLLTITFRKHKIFLHNFNDHIASAITIIGFQIY